ncbi:hypothetical protein [[Eubacterium] cellulosolvens]
MTTRINPDLFRCRGCGRVNMPIEDVAILSFPGNYEEPPEYEYRCSYCNAGEDFITEMETIVCRGCEDVQVQDEGDYCDECLGEMAEARRDAMLDSMMEEG